jgi:hypothetical protein
MSDYWTVVELNNVAGAPPLQAHAMASVRWTMHDGSKHWSKGRICLQERHDLQNRVARYRFLVEGRRLNAGDGRYLSNVVSFDALRIPVNCEWQTERGLQKATSIVVSKNRIGKIIFLCFPPNDFGIQDIQVSMNLSVGHNMIKAVQKADQERRNISGGHQGHQGHQGA